MLKIVRSAVLLTSIGLALPATAIEFGRAHLASAPGKPLRITIQVRDLSPQDLQTLTVRVASEQQWQQAGLTPPVALSTMSVRIIDGPRPNTRLLEVRADAVPSSSVIDVLLDVSSASTQRVLQSSLISHAAPTVRLSGETQNILRGDTLIGVAQQFPVAGATLYQMLWALFSANPHAFISDNMNLLKAGVSLSIPSSAQVLEVNAAFARQQYLAHVQAFNASRGRPGVSAIPANASTTAVADKSASSGQVETAKPQVVPNATDRVQLSAADGGQQANQADQKTSQAHAQRDTQERVQGLEQNIEALKGALAVAGTNQGSSTSATQGNQQTASQETTTATPGMPADSATLSDGVTNTAANNNAQSAATSGTSDTSATSSGAANGGNPALGSQTVSSTTSADNNPTSNAQSSTDHASSNQASSDSRVEQVKQWVSDNVLAAGALFLALIALVFAWIMRSSAQRVTSGRDSSTQAKAFEEKLKQIDLNLNESASSTPASAAPAPNSKGKGGGKR